MPLAWTLYERVVLLHIGSVKAQIGPLNLAVEGTRREAKAELLEHLRALTPGQFRHVIRLLLDALGYEEVQVTGQAGDRGIDVKAVLRYRGVADVPTFVQAKRYAGGNNVDGATVGRLRGSLPVDAHGVVITTSDSTKQARSEMSASELKPIALIDGPALVALLVGLGIGSQSARSRSSIATRPSWTRTLCRRA